MLLDKVKLEKVINRKLATAKLALEENLKLSTGYSKTRKGGTGHSKTRKVGKTKSFTDVVVGIDDGRTKQNILQIKFTRGKKKITREKHRIILYEEKPKKIFFGCYTNLYEGVG